MATESNRAGRKSRDAVKEELAGLRVAFPLFFVVAVSVIGAMFTRTDLSTVAQRAGAVAILLLVIACIGAAVRFYDLLEKL